MTIRDLPRRLLGRARRALLAPVATRRIARAERRFSAARADAEAYTRYVRAQIDQTRAKARKDASFRLAPAIRLVVDSCEGLSEDSRVLSIGTRNIVELDLLARHGLHNVSAIDLWPTSGRIRQADMHDLPFDDDSFDLIFASHAFEHSYDFPRVARECMRVLRPGGYLFCAVPVHFEPNEHDRVDFGDAQGLTRHFEPARPHILFESTTGGEMRVILRLDGAARRSPP